MHLMAIFLATYVVDCSGNFVSGGEPVYTLHRYETLMSCPRLENNKPLTVVVT